MRKISDWAILIIGILLFIAAYNFDEEANLFFNGVKFSIFDAALRVITNFGVVILVMLAIPTVIFYNKDKKTIKLLLLAFIVSFALAFVIKLMILRQRPIESFTFPFTTIINYSFPSMHAMVVFSLLPILTKYLNKQKFFWISFGLLAVFSRIYLGFHFLSDVVFGAFAGYFIGNYLLKSYEKKKIWKQTNSN